MILDHHYFQLPADRNTNVWRYLSFTKYLALLESRSLYFARADHFEDPFEGTVPDRTRDYIARFLKDKSDRPEDLADEFLRLVDHSRLFSFINCWHLNPAESDAMWRLYAFAGEGVAIQSTVAQLHDALAAASDRVLLGAVQSVDFDQIEAGAFFNGLTPYIFKRRSYEHEHELRAMIWVDVPDSALASAERVRLNPPAEVGRLVPVDLESLVETVVVSPAAPRWFGDLVRSVTSRYGFAPEIVVSTLYDPPARRTARKSGDAEVSFSITRETFEYLHKQHLEYTEVRLREKERLAQRQSEAIAGWYSEIQKDVESVELEGRGNQKVVGKPVFDQLATIIPGLPLEDVLTHPAFERLYFISGRVDNVLREIDRSVLSEEEKDLHRRKVIFLYTEAISKPQIALVAKLQKENTDPMVVAETSRPLIGLIVAQVRRLDELMRGHGI